MGDKSPQFIRDIVHTLSEDRYRYKFENDTGYKLSEYKNNTELATAFILHREHVGFDYGLMYPEHGKRQCEIDFSLRRKTFFNLPPWYGYIVNWPPNKPVRYIENKRSVHGKYIRKSEVVMDKLMAVPKRYWKSSPHFALLQREFLLREGYETFPIGNDELKWFYYKGLLAVR